ncbi:S1 RNA-binding domain-containing protein [Candidatus Epulonipiscium viviparus]|uniref:S1 RNA-binding domain-containing protein n=1 Tax=Candidatus Epulonipiscium viviparus TaxID=420336 RepID=UPI00016BFB5D|nr:S1 RNA-binding domain-containing protein [Candidatus Epulopiscium viviparus]
MSEKIEVGQILEGTVTGIKPFGAFISLPNSYNGLVHISHITHGYLENIADAIKIGDVVKVKVLTVDLTNNKISLSIKEALEKPKQEERPKPRYNKPKKEPEVVIDGFEALMKGFLKDSTERQTDINRRLNR